MTGTLSTTPLPLRLAGLATLTLATAAMANDDPQSLGTLVDEADLVFRGVVKDIQYVLSEPAGPQQARIPYTFVTYRVDDVVQGPEPGLDVTLRFIGGLDPHSLQYMAASHVPQFDLGDEDVLFVQGNTRDMCPLVDYDKGRFRVLGDQIYTETGRAVTLTDDGFVRRGDRFRFDQVISTNVAGRIFKRNPGPDIAEGKSDAITADALIAALEAFAFAGPMRPFADADPGLPFAGPDMTPAAPPALADGPAPAAIDPSVAAERKQVERDAPAERAPARGGK